jgi:hypothetical protein
MSNIRRIRDIHMNRIRNSPPSEYRFFLHFYGGGNQVRDAAVVEIYSELKRLTEELVQLMN